jgi:uncharacterized protein
MYEAALNDEDAVGPATIPVEGIDGPILLISGDQDRMWPASRMAQTILARLKRHRREGGAIRLRYADAGHRLTPRGPATGIGRLRTAFDLGGSPVANDSATADAWPKAVAFLKATLS